MRSPRLAVTILLSLFVASFAVLPRALAKDDAEEQIEAFEEKMKEADEAGKVRLIEGLATSGNPEAAKAIGKYMTDRSTAVAVAALKAIGDLKDEKSLGKLMGLVKATEKEPRRLAAVVGAIGAIGDRKGHKTLVDVAKKWLFKDSEVASAAATGLGNVPLKASVDELIKLLDLTFPRQASGGASISSETRQLLEDSRPAIIGALQSLTGWDFKDANAWQRFWDHENRTWKPGGLEALDLTKLDKWVDPGYGFEIERPESWAFDRSEDYKAYRIFMSKKSADGVTLAYVYVTAYKNVHGMTPEQKAQEYEDSFRSNWKDIKDDTFVREDCKVGREKAFTHHFTGMDAYGSIAKLRNVYLTLGENIFILGTWLRSGLTDDTAKELQEAIDSFRVFE